MKRTLILNNNGFGGGFAAARLAGVSFPMRTDVPYAHVFTCRPSHLCQAKNSECVYIPNRFYDFKFSTVNL